MFTCMPPALIEKEMEIGRRELMYRIGLDAENAVAEKLSNIYGYRNVSVGIDGFSDGTDGYPDISLIKDGDLFYIEVKSITPFTKYKGTNKTNSVKLNKNSWALLKERAKGKIASIIMIIELRINYGENDYFLIEYDTLEDFVLKSKGEWVHIPLWFILMNCKKMYFTYNELVYNPIDTNQTSLKI